MNKKEDLRYNSFNYNKKAQMNISFGMIFSIILIVIFIAFAFYVIQKFLGLQESILNEKFVSDLQNDVNSAWRASQSSREISYHVDRNVIEVCFRESETYNLFIETKKGILRKNIDNLDMEKIIGNEGEFCIPSSDRKIQMIIEKDFGDTLVTIKSV